MAETKIDIYTPTGVKVGSFKNPKVEMLPEHHYFLSGRFYEPDGTAAERIEFNPQMLPYQADISQVSHCIHAKLISVYVQRGRQPIEMVGVCQAD